MLSFSFKVFSVCMLSASRMVEGEFTFLFIYAKCVVRKQPAFYYFHYTCTLVNVRHSESKELLLLAKLKFVHEVNRNRI